ncbi:MULTISPECIES: DEAD/DEAH box helicase [unclassified Bradyrhizobium]|uniref:DEAD/DEAH box helicase n=1 Tax=unclassified Bradyrhizobium TaxID=2631580 RepID=UPI001CD4B706|nr:MULTISPECIES: DEAD/DEAH box helicase [unclassified Bradyrhizobium]MCA1377496.1 DEAD/DEAH box helicase [Bradyrhizobium sp. IC4060]MCA1485849.1 DEAD/DEAH box helicase [Bradyrhizobium sp. IC4061]
MTQWITDALGEASLAEATTLVSKALLADVTGVARPTLDESTGFVADSLELAVFELLDEADKRSELRSAAEKAFELLRTLQSDSANVSEKLKLLLRTACYGVLADRTPDVSRFLKDTALPELATDFSNWGEAVRNNVTVIWLKLLRKKGWEDLDAVLEGVVSLRQAQTHHESSYLETRGSQSRSAAWELIAIYHLAKAAEILATYSTQGSVSGAYNIREQLEGQFDRSTVACERAELFELFGLSKLLTRTAEQMVANSIWTVTRAVNSRVSRFVARLVDRANQKPLFEMLPPQRITLREQGLLGSGHRAVVVSLPTSSGKTLIAQFRILQALNQFDGERGWVAYLAPTRALVNQICARLRRDFEPLGVVVERVSPALEIDGVEAEILATRNPQQEFRILVGTPEKVDLLLRGGWEEKIGRPLTLVVVDEAHNLSQGEREIRLELLLATINRECRYSQFLLLTPFINNSAEVARWLSPDSNADIGVQFEWKPNDRAIAIAQPRKGDRAGDFTLGLSTVHTSKETIDIAGELELCAGRPLGLTWSDVRNSLLKTSAATAHCLNRRGTTIVVASKIPHTWTIARTLSKGLSEEAKRVKATSEDIEFVRDFIGDEFGADFELLDFLKNGIGLHHSGLSDEIRLLMEWLVERGQLSTLVATTTIAQGVNFPVSGVVLAGHQYPYGMDMPPEDFWNLAGRAGRADQAGLGVVALAATDDARAENLKSYIGRNVSSLNSLLVTMVTNALSRSNGNLELQTLFHMKEWSAFLQYLAHSYRQVGDHSTFASQVEQILRGSFGFQKIRQQSSATANALVNAVQRYAAILRGKPLSLVDSTGFSWESVSRALAGVREQNFRPEMWTNDQLFRDGNSDLARAFGVLFKVPEIRSELSEAIHGKGADSDLLARIVKDWVHGASIPEIADSYFPNEDDKTDSITNACRSVYGKLIQTASWGLSALQSLTIGSTLDQLSAEEQRTVRNLPSRIYYGVNSDAAIDLRLLGVPRKAAQPLADAMVGGQATSGIANVRVRLNELTPAEWEAALGRRGKTYSRAWRVIEGRE